MGIASYMIFNVITLSLCFFCACYGIEMEMTIKIEPGKEDSFYEEAKVGETIEFDYQVIAGGHGDIDFRLTGPSGQVVFEDFKQSSNYHRIEVTETGVYEFTLGNKFSSFSTKMVFFDLTIRDENAEEEWENTDNFYGLNSYEVYEIAVQEIERVLSQVRSHLHQIQHFQESLRSHEAKDRNIAESNFERVNFWSIVQISVMIVVGLIQVILLKSLFDDKSYMHKVFRKMFSS